MASLQFSDTASDCECSGLGIITHVYSIHLKGICNEKQKKMYWNPGTYISITLDHCRTFSPVVLLWHRTCATHCSRSCSDSMDLYHGFVEIDKKTTTCSFLGFIITYLLSWMYRYCGRGIQYDENVRYAHLMNDTRVRCAREVIQHYLCKLIMIPW